ncbi:hypothetical protein [Eoetvoesiella caeni]
MNLPAKKQAMSSMAKEQGNTCCGIKTTNVEGILLRNVSRVYNSYISRRKLRHPAQRAARPSAPIRRVWHVFAQPFFAPTRPAIQREKITRCFKKYS